MLEKVKDWMRALLDAPGDTAAVEPEQYARRYEAADEDRITPVIANKLATMTFADSTLEVLGDGARAAMIRDMLRQVWDDGASVVAQALGKGGKVILPVVRGGRLAVHAIDQSRMAIRAAEGGRLSDVTILCDRCKVGKRWLYLLADYRMLSDGRQRIAYRVTDADGGEKPLKAVKAWADITEEIVIEGTDRLLLGYMRCPRDDRTDHRGHGVPITYGAEADVRELMEHIAVYRREFKLSRMMLGLDSALWRNPMNGAAAGDISAVRKTVQDSDDPFVPWDSPSLEGKSAWQVYAPTIRHEAMEARYQSLCRRVEMDCGLSCGVLTERQRISYANRDEIRAAMYDTFCVVRAVRSAWERALQDAAYAADVLIDCCNLAPDDKWQLRFDWDYGLVESTEQTFSQNQALYAGGLMSGAELRQWALGGTLQQAEDALEQLAQQRGDQADGEEVE